MDAEQFEALRSAAREGVEADGLVVAVDGESYTFRTPDRSYEGLSVEGLREAARNHQKYVTEWYFWDRVGPDAPDRRAFLRWVEGAEGIAVPERRERLRDGLSREWGQLRVRARADGDGHRVYELRHADDADEPVEELTTHTDPLDAREIAKRDDRGRYRPLSTAPTLRRSWAFVDLGPVELVRAVDAFYPATIANWHREREGELDVSHWRETMERQTGIYGVVETWDRGEGHEHAEWVAEACCADSQCLKRREWEYDEETELDVEASDASRSGDGESVDEADSEFPCREPCSLVVSAARTWTRQEAEEPRSYELELTPSEKEQLEEIVDAVADGRIDEIREAAFDEGANRWRARFLRAKRFDDDGNLGGVPTGREEEEE